MVEFFKSFHRFVHRNKMYSIVLCIYVVKDSNELMTIQLPTTPRNSM